MKRARRIVTPEHVEISLEPAGLGRRFLALVMDFVLVTALSAAIAEAALNVLPSGFSFLVRALLLLVLTWGYHVYFEVRHSGQSPGKRIARIRVVDGRGLPIGLEQSFVRNVIRILDAAPLGYGFGAMVALFDPEGRRLGDIAADTLVVRETRTAGHERRATARARAFNSLRTPRVLRLIRHQISLEEREFLAALCLRAESLEDRARFDLMEEVGRHYRERLLIDEKHLSGENLVRGLAGVLFPERPGAGASSRSPRGRAALA